MKNIFFLGCGKMGSILAKNLVEEAGIDSSQIKILKKSNQNKIVNIQYFKNSSDIPKNYKADLVFLAIKPQNSAKILSDFSQTKIFHKKTIFISILAGKKIQFFENIFGKDIKLIRAMPNLPIQYLQGIFTYFTNKNITKSELNNLQKIFKNFGTSFELQDESFFDIATAIFGCGPAYIFLLQEILTEILIANKINKNQASELIKTLFLGSSLLACNSDLNFSELQESVASKGGTTEAALKVLQKNSAFKNIIKTAITAATQRSRELSDEK